jgi:hypothetical protein
VGSVGFICDPPLYWYDKKMPLQVLDAGAGASGVGVWELAKGIVAKMKKNRRFKVKDNISLRFCERRNKRIWFFCRFIKSISGEGGGVKEGKRVKGCSVLYSLEKAVFFLFDFFNLVASRN